MLLLINMYNVAQNSINSNYYMKDHLTLYGHLDKKILIKLEKNRKYDKNIYHEFYKQNV